MHSILTKSENVCIEFWKIDFWHGRNQIIMILIVNFIANDTILMIVSINLIFIDKANSSKCYLSK